MIKMRIFISLCTLFLLITLAHSSEQKENQYVSPDSRYVAVVVAMHESEESEVIVKSKDGRNICFMSYVSEHGDNGYSVEKATWTPDSKFFVYNLSSSGGHQPWHSPTNFCSIRDKSIQSLDDYVGPITDSNFEVKTPDIIKGKRMRKDLDDVVDFEVRLSRFVTDEQKK